MLYKLFGQTLGEGENKRISTGLWFPTSDPGKREGSPGFQATTHPYPQQNQSHKQPTETRHTLTHRNGVVQRPLPRPESGRKWGRAQTTSQGARNKERSKTDLRLSVLRTGEKNKVGGRARPAWPRELQDGGWALPLLALRGRKDQGSGVGASLCPGRGLV